MSSPEHLNRFKETGLDFKSSLKSYITFHRVSDFTLSYIGFHIRNVSPRGRGKGEEGEEVRALREEDKRKQAEKERRKTT